MEVEIFVYRMRDKLNNTYCVEPRRATAGYIALMGGEIVSGPTLVDEAQIDLAGREILRR